MNIQPQEPEAEEVVKETESKKRGESLLADPLSSGPLFDDPLFNDPLSMTAEPVFAFREPPVMVKHSKSRRKSPPTVVVRLRMKRDKSRKLLLTFLKDFTERRFTKWYIIALLIRTDGLRDVAQYSPSSQPHKSLHFLLAPTKTREVFHNSKSYNRQF